MQHRVSVEDAAGLEQILIQAVDRQHHRQHEEHCAQDTHPFHHPCHHHRESQRHGDGQKLYPAHQMAFAQTKPQRPDILAPGEPEGNLDFHYTPLLYAWAAASSSPAPASMAGVMRAPPVRRANSSRRRSGVSRSTAV